MTKLRIEDLPEKVLYEYYTCNDENPKRCRRRAVVYMDGMGYCADHVDRMSPSLLRFARRIRYEVSR